jgi:CRP/FNR family transcriptional regulator, cyclic AMP receptor protein
MWPELRFRSGERIVAQGDTASSVFLVRRGVVEVSSVSADGKEVILALAGPGHVFCEGALCGPETAMPAAAAATDCAVSPVPVAALVESGPLSTVLVGMAMRLVDATTDLEHLHHHRFEVRLAAVLVRLAERYATEIDGEVRIGLALTQRDLASMLGASRETVNRAFSTLRALGWAHRRGSALVVDDLEALRRLARNGA